MWAETWEWKLQDIHGFIEVGSIIIGWFISDYFKQLLDQFKIAEPYHFYASKLKYKSIGEVVYQYAVVPVIKSGMKGKMVIAEVQY